MNETCSGLLKQQIVDENGLYKWELKYFILKVSTAILIVYPDDYETVRNLENRDENNISGEGDDGDDDESIICRLSLIGSKYAKEWSISTPTVGSFGFDILWSSGRIWSFLAEDEYTCKKWVQSINQTIEDHPILKEQGGNHSKKIGENKIPFEATQQLANDSSTRTQIEELSPQRNSLERIPVPQTTQRYPHTPPPTSAVTEGRERKEHDQLHSDQNLLNRFVTNETNSLLSTIPPHSSPSDISPESNTSASDQAAKPRYPSSRHENEILEPYNMMTDEPTPKTRHSTTSETHRTNAERNSQRTQRELSDQLTYMTERCHYYNNLSEEYLKETDAARTQLELVREEWSQKYSLLETKIRLLTEKDLRNSSVHSFSTLLFIFPLLPSPNLLLTHLAQNHHKEIESAMIRIQSENQSLHEATLKSLKDQHQREIKCLREELANERKK
jgi:hypothetical protein